MYQQQAVNSGVQFSELWTYELRGRHLLGNGGSGHICYVILFQVVNVCFFDLLDLCQFAVGTLKLHIGGKNVGVGGSGKSFHLGGSYIEDGSMLPFCQWKLHFYFMLLLSCATYLLLGSGGEDMVGQEAVLK